MATINEENLEENIQLNNEPIPETEQEIPEAFNELENFDVVRVQDLYVKNIYDDGTKLALGVQGAQGYQGPQGVVGAQGVQGYQGTQGSQGFQGPQGVQGGSAGSGSYSNGVDTHNVATTGEQTIAHGLGAAPSSVRITASVISSQATLGTISFGAAIYGDVGNAMWILTGETGDPNLFETGTDGTHVLYLKMTDGTYSQATATLDDTNITLTWSKSGLPTGTAQILWEANI